MDYLLGSSGEAAIGNKKLSVRIGPSRHHLSLAHVNNESQPHYIDSPYFCGHVLVRIKNFRGIEPSDAPQNTSQEYFGSHKRLFAIQVQGRFKHEYTAEDVVFGAEFEKKISPPTGAWVAIKFANLIDPALQTDIYAEKPWLYSPMLCSMNVVNVQPATAGVSTPIPALVQSIAGPDLSTSDREIVEKTQSISKTSFDGQLNPLLGTWTPGELKEDTTLLYASDRPFAIDSIQGRRKHFHNQAARKSLVFTPDNVYNFEIFAPFIDLNTFDLTLGINVNLMRYLESQPITLMSKSLSTNVPFFAIEFALVDKVEEEQDEFHDVQES